jgi:outer membrane lipoprotein-sorting protein
MKKILAPLLTLLALFGSFGAFAQSGDPLALLKEVQTKTLALKDQNIQFAMVIEAPGRDGKKVQRKTSGQVQVVGEKALLVLNGQKIFLDGNRLTTVSEEDEEIIVRKLDGDETQYTPASILKKYETGSNFQWAGEETVAGGTKVVYIRMKPKNNVDVRDVVLGINMRTKRIHSYQEFGTNDVITTLRIVQYDVNQGVNVSKVTFNKANYPGYDYIAPKGM